MYRNEEEKNGRKVANGIAWRPIMGVLGACPV